jgi:hypothetical protein
MTDYYDGHLEVAAEATVAYVKEPRDFHKGDNYYKVIFKDKIADRMYVYNNHKVRRIDYFNKDGILIKYEELGNNKEVTTCSVNYYKVDTIHIEHVIKCSNGNKYVNTYLKDGEHYS